ncbi:MAG: hypothetical protein V4534_03080 [Myxococcota bacterium]
MEILLVYKRPRPEELENHDASFRRVEDVLKLKRIAFETCFREDLSSGKIKDRLIITVGGDGTLLEASHSVADNVLMGVNSNPNTSVGSLCVADMNNFSDVLDDFLSGKLQPTQVTRMQIELGGKQLPVLALNDILIANQNPAAMTRYEVTALGQTSFHKNSGLWVCTPCGSSGAVCSTGGRVQPIQDRRLQWVCREPYFARMPVPALLAGFLPEGESLRIRSCTSGGRLFIDGPHLQESFEEGTELILSASKSILNWLITPEMENRRQQIGLLRELYEFERRDESAGV